MRPYLGACLLALGLLSVSLSLTAPLQFSSDEVVSKIKREFSHGKVGAIDLLLLVNYLQSDPPFQNGLDWSVFDQEESLWYCKLLENANTSGILVIRPFGSERWQWRFCGKLYNRGSDWRIRSSGVLRQISSRSHRFLATTICDIRNPGQKVPYETTFFFVDDLPG